MNQDRKPARPRGKKAQPIEPNLRTQAEDYSSEEHFKLNSNGTRGMLSEEFRDLSFEEISDASASIAKSHGIYLSFDRAKTGKEKDWRYMVRVSIPGGGPLDREQWGILDDIATEYTTNPYLGQPSLRLTTRQNIQFHWIQKQHIVDMVQRIATTGFYTLNGCGDNARNVMACPASHYSDVFNANEWAHRVGEYFRLPVAAHIQVFAIDPEYLRQPEQSFSYGPSLLNRKFKIAFSAFALDEETGAYVPDNCVEARTNDVGVAPILDDGNVERFQLYIGGGQGERNGKNTFCALGKPFAIVTEEQLMTTLDAIAQVHQEWGDRQNRHWARLKYVVYKQGIEWYRDQVQAITGSGLGQPDPEHDYGDRHLHHGWQRQATNGLLTFGAFIENGRLVDGENGQLKTMVRHLLDHYPIQAMVTPNQDLLLTNIPTDAREAIEADMKRFGQGQRNGKPFSALRMHSGACVGRDTCKLTYTDSEKFEPVLIDELETKWSDLEESIGITGCERQCFRPATKTIGWIGMGLNRYKLKIGGTEDARCQGEPLKEPGGDQIYLRSVPRDSVSVVTDVLFEYYSANRQPDEKMGYFFQRAGNDAIVALLQSDPRTAELMEQTYNPY